MKSERGITLVVLSITIIILSIITYVTIRQFSSNDSDLMEITDENYKQRNMVEKEKEKMSNVMDSLEEEWGLS